MRRILEDRPEARPRLQRAVSSLLMTTLVAVAILGLLLIWHLRRRADLIRNRLAPPRDVSLDSERAPRDVGRASEPSRGDDPAGAGLS